MSWSVSLQNVKKSDAAEQIKKVLQDAPAYKEDGLHQAVMDKCAEAAVAMLSPSTDEESKVVHFSSYGHAGTDGSGSATVTVSFGQTPTA